jgi:hypothetical protein
MLTTIVAMSCWSPSIRIALLDGSVTNANGNRHAESDRRQQRADVSDGARPPHGTVTGGVTGGRRRSRGSRPRDQMKRTIGSGVANTGREGGNTMKLTHISFVVGTILPLLTACRPESADTRTTTAALRSGDTTTPVEDFPKDSPAETKPRPDPFGPQRFAGAVLDQARAEAIAEGAGFDLVAFHRCAFDAEECAMFEVQGPRNVFMYQVSASRCRTLVFDDPEQAATVGARVSRATTSRSAQSPTSDDTSAASTGAGADHGEPTWDPAAGDASACFAGYTADYRFREASTLYADYRGFEIKMEHHYQLIVNGFWTDVVTTITSTWDMQIRPDSSMRTRGWSYELRDSNDDVIGSDGVLTESIASSGSSSTDASLEARCQAKQRSLETQQAVAIAEGEAVCRLATLFMPDSSTVSIDLTPLGVGGSVEATKNQDLCGGGANISTKKSEAAGAQLFEDCLENPGRYFPVDYPPPTRAIDYQELPGFESPYATQDVGAGQGCPATMVAHEVVEMADGSVCEADVSRTCELQSNGSCRCSNGVVVGEMVCTCDNPSE